MYDYFLTTEGGDILTTEGGDPLLLFTLTNNLMYGLGVDWGSNGSAIDESGRLLRWTSERGREKIFRPSGDGFNPYEIGRLTVTLDNHDGRYDPWNTASELYGDIMPGLDVTFSTLTYDVAQVDGHNTYRVFTGTLVDIQVNGHNETVTLIIEDGWRYLSDWSFYKLPFTTAGFGVGYELIYAITEYNLTLDPATLVYAREGPPMYPWSSFVNTTTDGDLYLPRHWWWDGTAKSAVEMITFGALGRSWIRSDNKFSFEDFQYTTDAVVATLNEDTLLKDIYLPLPWENMRSEIVLKGSRNAWYRNQAVTTLTQPILIAASATVNANLRYEYGDIRTIYGTRVVGVTIVANAAADGTGADLSGDITYRIYPAHTDARIELTNTGATDAYVTTLTVTSEALEVIPDEWRYESTIAYRDSSFVLDSPWLSVTSIGQVGGYLQATTTTVNDIARIELIGDSLLEYLSVVRPFPTVQMQGRYDDQFDLELEDKVTFTAPTVGIDDDFRITKIAHRSMGTTQDVLTTMWLYPPITPTST